jgi:hypothetical protein
LLAEHQLVEPEMSIVLSNAYAGKNVLE